MTRLITSDEMPYEEWEAQQQAILDKYSFTDIAQWNVSKEDEEKLWSTQHVDDPIGYAIDPFGCSAASKGEKQW